jgi:hypothetical protein
MYDNIFELPQLTEAINGATFNIIVDTFGTRQTSGIIIRTYGSDTMYGPNFVNFNTYTDITNRYQVGFAHINRLCVQSLACCNFQITALPNYGANTNMRWYISELRGNANMIGGLGPNDKYLCIRNDKDPYGIKYKEYGLTSSFKNLGTNDTVYNMTTYEYDMSKWRTPEFIL